MDEIVEVSIPVEAEAAATLTTARAVLFENKNQKTFAVLRMGFGSSGQTFS